MRYLLFVIVLPMSLGLHAQNPYQSFSVNRLDSILEVHQADTYLVHAYNVLAEREFDSDPSLALNHAKEALDLAQRLQFSFGEAEAEKNTGILLGRTGKLDEAISSYEQAVTRANTLNNQLLLASIFFARGNTHFSFGEYETSLSYHEKAYQLFKTYGTKASLASSHNSLGVLNYLDPEKQIFHYGEALRLAKETDNYSLQGIISLNLGDIFRTQKGDFKKALAKYKEASSVFDSLDNKRGLAASYLQMGGIYAAWEEYGKALKYYQKAYAIRDTMADKNGLISSATNIAEVYYDMGNYREALAYCRKANHLAKEVENELQLGILYNVFGMCYIPLNMLDSARHFAQKGLALLNNDNNIRYAGGSYSILSEIEEKDKNPVKALYFINQAYEIAKKTQDTRKIGQYSGTLASIYLNMDSRQKKKSELSFSELESILSNSIQIANASKEYAFQEQMYTSIIQLYKQYKRYPNKIIAFQDSLIHIKDSLFSQNKAAELGEWATRLETFEQEKEIQLLEKQQQIDQQEKALLNARNRLALIIAGALLLLLALGGFLYGKLRKNKIQIESQNTELQQLNATKDHFFSVIAHDLRNPIVALEGVGEQMQYYLEKNRPEKLSRLAERTGRTASKLTGLLDNLLNWALAQKGSMPYQPREISLKKSIQENIELYEEAAALKGISLEYEVEDHIALYADDRAVNTVLRNLINNAIKFTDTGGKVLISSNASEDSVNIEVRDNGLGMKEEQLSSIFDLGTKRSKGTAGEKGTGLGLTLCKDLITLNKGNIRVESAFGEGTTVHVRLPSKPIS